LVNPNPVTPTAAKPLEALMSAKSDHAFFWPRCCCFVMPAHPPCPFALGNFGIFLYAEMAI